RLKLNMGDVRDQRRFVRESTLPHTVPWFFTGHGSQATGHDSYSPRKARPGIVRPAEAGQAAAEGARDSGRQKCLNVVEASRVSAAPRCFVECEELLPALTGRAC